MIKNLKESPKKGLSPQSVFSLREPFRAARKQNGDLSDGLDEQRRRNNSAGEKRLTNAASSNNRRPPARYSTAPITKLPEKKTAGCTFSVSCERVSGWGHCLNGGKGWRGGGVEGGGGVVGHQL